MNKEIFEQIFKNVSRNIIELGINKGYFDIDKKQQLQEKLSQVVQNEIQELDDSQGLAFLNPNNNTFGFNLKQIKTEQEAIILVFHELKHLLDQYNDYDNEHHIDNSHIGFHQQHSDFGKGQNESTTERFAVNMMEEFTGNKATIHSYNELNVSFDTDMVRYQIEDKLNKLFCEALGIEQDELISMQNDENMDRLNSLISKFNEGADYERYFAALDGIYELRYGANSKEDCDFSEDEIRQIHEYIQLAQDEFEKFMRYRNPKDLEMFKSNFITTDPKYRISEEQKDNLVQQIHGKNSETGKDTSLLDMFSLIRMDLIDSAVEATESVIGNGVITEQQQIIIQENTKSQNKDIVQE